MSDLPETLRETCSVVAELENDRAHGAKSLRVRVDLITTAYSMVATRAEEPAEITALARLARELREEASLARRRHRVVKRMVLAMMD